jgi:hypothetical protein
VGAIAPQTLSKEIMDALEAHTAISKQAIGSEKVREGLKDVLLRPFRPSASIEFGSASIWAMWSKRPTAT